MTIDIKTSFIKIMDDLEQIDSESQRELLISMGNQMITRADQVQKMADECDDDRVSQMACKIGASSNFVNRLIDQVNLLLANGMWFSDACEIVCILNPLKENVENFDNHEIMSEFWDFMCDCCFSPKGVEPKTKYPIF
jgi:hypothetical protein